MSASQFHTEIVAHQHALLDAAAIAGLSANAIEAHDLSGVTVPQASLRWPSFFCDEGGYVRVLAYLLQNNLPFELEVAPCGLGGGRYKLHPPVDTHTQRILAAIDPRRASELDGMQARTHRVFERLRAAALPADAADGDDRT